MVCPKCDSGSTRVFWQCASVGRPWNIASMFWSSLEKRSVSVGFWWRCWTDRRCEPGLCRIARKIRFIESDRYWYSWMYNHWARNWIGVAGLATYCWDSVFGLLAVCRSNHVRWLSVFAIQNQRWSKSSFDCSHTRSSPGRNLACRLSHGNDFE